jgi:SAM-dependent methyltransferase
MRKFTHILNEQYSSATEMWNDLYGKIGTGKYTQSTPDNNIDKISSIIKRGKVLDVGVGDGSNALYFDKKGYDVYGIDISDVAINKIKDILPNNTWILQDISEGKLPFREGMFDIIFSRLSLHYFNDEQTSNILDEFHRTITMNGLLFVSVKIVNVGGINTGKSMRTKEQWDELISKRFEIIESNVVVKQPYDYDPAPSNMLEIYARPLK